jgi:hypothetical protein
VKSTILNQYPVDCLLIEGHDHSLWKPWVTKALPEAWPPAAILTYGGPSLLSQEEGPLSKSLRKDMQRMGYEVRYWYMSAWKYGTALRQERLTVAYFLPEKGTFQ